MLRIYNISAKTLKASKTSLNKQWVATISSTAVATGQQGTISPSEGTFHKN